MIDPELNHRTNIYLIVVGGDLQQKLARFVENRVFRNFIIFLIIVVIINV